MSSHKSKHFARNASIGADSLNAAVRSRAVVEIHVCIESDGNKYEATNSKCLRDMLASISTRGAGYT